MKKILLTILMTLLMSSTCFAEERQKDIYDEGVEQVMEWANARKDEIMKLDGEAARYDAIIKTVCDFLTYDSKYTFPCIQYTLRDGKGVCADYAALTKALCDVCGIEAEVHSGNAHNGAHDWLRVSISGTKYYSDPTGADVDCAKYKLSKSLWSGYTYGNSSYELRYAVMGTGTERNSAVDTQLSAPTGYSACTLPTGKVVYIRDSDITLIAEGEVAVSDILKKYGIEG